MADPIPSPAEAGLAFEELANLCELVAITHSEEGQRVTVIYHGRSLSNVDAFAARAAVLLRARLHSSLPQELAVAREELKEDIRASERERIAQKLEREFAGVSGDIINLDSDSIIAWVRDGGR